MGRLVVIMAVAIVSGCATIGWRSQKIDGSTHRAFEESVALLQEGLPPRRRAELETSLAVIWLRETTAGAGDLDSDGSIDVAEVRVLLDDAERVLTDIRRGVFITAIERRGASADRYVRQLAGLGYDGVIDLAALTSGDVFVRAARQQEVQVRCEVYRSERLKSSLMSRYCRGH